MVDKQNYLSEIAALCRIDWPANRIVNVVCHGHSVPAGYFKTPVVHSLGSYPHLLRVGLAAKYLHAVINVIVTAIGGENSERGAARFESDVLSHRPDVVTIDYGLNDRGIGLERANVAWASMIEKAKSSGAKVLLLTPTTFEKLNFESPEEPLNQHAEQIRRLAVDNEVGLVDSLQGFRSAVRGEVDPMSLLSQINHPSEKGHAIVGKLLLEWFN